MSILASCFWMRGVYEERSAGLPLLRYRLLQGGLFLQVSAFSLGWGRLCWRVLVEGFEFRFEGLVERHAELAVQLPHFREQPVVLGVSVGGRERCVALGEAAAGLRVEDFSVSRGAVIPVEVEVRARVPAERRNRPAGRLSGGVESGLGRLREDRVARGGYSARVVNVAGWVSEEQAAWLRLRLRLGAQAWRPGVAAEAWVTRAYLGAAGSGSRPAGRGRILSLRAGSA